MALVTIGLPVFSGGPDEDVERHVELFSGYLNGLGVDPAGMAGAPSGEQRSRGLFRASLSGEAGEWYDNEFIGKHWELNNLFNNHGQNAWANVVGRTMQRLNATNSFRNPSGANTYATIAGNAGTALNASGLLPAYGLIQNWDDLGGRPTIRPATNLAGGGDANPVVLPEIRVGNIIYWFRKNYTTVQRARREAKFGDLVQGDMPIDAYYKELEKTGRLLEYPEQVVENQFFRGLNAENLIEADRQGDRPLADLVASLRKIEKRKAEMKLGVSRRNVQSDPQYYNIAPVQAPPVTSAQEPGILKPVTSHAITQDMLDKLLKSHTDNLTKSFQSQLQTLQDTVAQAQKKVPPPIPPKDHRKLHEFYESHNPFDDDYDRQFTFDEIMGNNRESMAYAKMFAKASAKAKKDKMERKVNKLAKMMGGLSVEDDDSVPMDIDIADGVILQDADGNEFTVSLTRGSKKKLMRSPL